MEGLREYLLINISSFNADPADTDFQRGYLEALEDVHKHFFPTQERPAHENKI